MQICDGQKLGALTILIVSLIVYGRALNYDQQSLMALSLPWGNQEPGMMAAEITGSRDADGIYFFPEGMDIANIVQIININGRIVTDSFTPSDGTAIEISLADGTLTISDMTANKRLALGVLIDLNRASAEDLSSVPGIGERMAIEIVQRRQTVGKFKSLSDLTTVPGIKEKKLTSLKKYLTIVATP